VPADIPLPKGPFTPERITQLLRQREHVVQELVTTEENYVGQLNIFLENFVKPMKEKNLLDTARLFPAIENIFMMHSMLKDELKAAGVDAQEVAKVIAKLGPFLKMYTPYVNNYMTTIKTLKEARNNNNSVRNFLKKQSKAGHNIESLLIGPIQRIPRYELLLKEILKHTPPDQPDRDILEQTFLKVKELAKIVNDCTKEKENLDHCNEIAQ